MAKTLLYFQSSFSEMSERMAEAVRQESASLGWNLRVIPYGNAVPRDMCSRVDICSRRTLSGLLSTWRPDGCIVEYSVPSALPERMFGRIPVVYLDRLPPSRRTCSCVYCDDVSCVECASTELFSIGINNFAYVPWITRTTYSVARHNAFKRLVSRMSGSTFAFCKESTARNSAALREFLRRLSLPCGILAYNDFIARRIVDGCMKIGLSVPDDVAVVGVDDDTVTCETGDVTISSVAMDYFGAGIGAVRLLSERMASPQAICRSMTFGASGMVRRQSTRRFPARDAFCQRAVEYIRIHAAEGIGVGDVAAALALPLRTAQRRFRAITGKSLRDELRDARFDSARRRLSERTSTIKGLADFVGYDSDSTLRKMFRARLGVSLRVFRAGKTKG